MRFWISTLLLLSLAAQCAHAKPPALARQNAVHRVPSASSQAAFRMPESERKAIADYPSEKGVRDNTL